MVFFYHCQTSIVLILITLSSDTKIFLKMYRRTLNDDWNASRSAVGILRRVQSLAISAPVVDNSNLQNYLYLACEDMQINTEYEIFYDAVYFATSIEVSHGRLST